MKAGFATSLVLHVAVLGFGLVTLSAPRALDAADVEALPVDIIPIEALTQLQQGDKTASVKEKPAPKPTRRTDAVADARNAGENAIDLDNVPTPQPKPRKVETAAAPPPTEEPAPRPEPRPEPEAEKQPEAKPVPATEVTPTPQPKQDIAPDPVAEAIAAETAADDSVKIPDEVPLPQRRPEPPKAQTAKAPERKDAEKPQKKAEKAPKPDDLEALTDEVAALLNKEAPSGGGAKRSVQEASLGSNKPSTGEKLSQSEMDALRQRLGGCWSIPAGVDDADALKVSVRFRLDRSGMLEERPEIIAGGAATGPGRTAAESAVRAVQKCEPFNLPADKYETWAEVVVNFDPSEMF